MCNLLDVSGDGSGLSMLDRSVEFGQARLGLRRLSLTPVGSNLLFWPRHFIYCSLLRSTTDVGTPPFEPRTGLDLDWIMWLLAASGVVDDMEAFRARHISKMVLHIVKSGPPIFQNCEGVPLPHNGCTG